MNKYILVMSLGLLLPGVALYGMNDTQMKEHDESGSHVPMNEAVKQEYQAKRAVLGEHIQELWDFLNQAGSQIEDELIGAGSDAQEALRLVESLQMSLAKTNSVLVQFDAQINAQK